MPYGRTATINLSQRKGESKREVIANYTNQTKQAVSKELEKSKSLFQTSKRNEP